MIRALHVCYSFPPDPLGGTEVYVRALCSALQQCRVESLVVAPGPRDETYEIDGLRVRRFSHAQTTDLAEIYTGDPQAAARFGQVLDEETPDVVHQHALSPACSPRLAGEAKKRGIPVVFTYHTPTASCLRGTLLEHGKEPCDGRLEIKRCTACNSGRARSVGLAGQAARDRSTAGAAMCSRRSTSRAVHGRRSACRALRGSTSRASQPSGRRSTGSSCLRRGWSACSRSTACRRASSCVRPTDCR